MLISETLGQVNTGGKILVGIVWGMVPELHLNYPSQIILYK